MNKNVLVNHVMNEKEIVVHLLSEAILQKTYDYEEYFSKILFITSNKMINEALLKNIEQFPLNLAFGLFESINDTTLMVKICKDRNLPEFIKDGINACDLHFKSIKKLIKKELSTKLQFYLAKMSKEDIEIYNLKVCKEFRYKI